MELHNSQIEVRFLKRQIKGTIGRVKDNNTGVLKGLNKKIADSNGRQENSCLNKMSSKLKFKAY